jgi:NitT/TauT family transport system ATP-binding protein
MILPKATTSEIVGLIEAINDCGGECDAARLASDFDLELDEILPAIQAAELLGFAIVHDGNIRLTELGNALVKSSINQRKLIFRGQISRLEAFQEIVDSLKNAKEHKLSKIAALEIIKRKISTRNLEGYFRLIINWGRYAELIGYRGDEDEVYLR